MIISLSNLSIRDNTLIGGCSSVLKNNIDSIPVQLILTLMWGYIKLNAMNEIVLIALLIFFRFWTFSLVYLIRRRISLTSRI